MRIGHSDPHVFPYYMNRSAKSDTLIIYRSNPIMNNGNGGLNMVEKNLKKLRAKKHRVTNGFNTGTRDMKLKTAYRRKKRWSADDSYQDKLHRFLMDL